MAHCSNRKMKKWSSCATSNSVHCVGITCSPFIGKAHGAYIPTRGVLGLSKIARVVDGVRVIIDFTSLQAIGRQCERELGGRFEEHRSRFPQKNFNSFWPYPFEFRQAFFERATISARRNNVADLAAVFSIHFVR